MVMEWEDLIELIGFSSLAGFFLYSSVNFSAKIDKLEILKDTFSGSRKKSVTNCKDITESYDKDLNTLFTGKINPLSATKFRDTTIYEVLVHDNLYTKKYHNCNVPCISLVD